MRLGFRRLSAVTRTVGVACALRDLLPSVPGERRKHATIRPSMKHSAQALVDKLTRSKIYTEYGIAFRNALGLPLAFTAPESWDLPFQDDANENPFCRLVARTGSTCLASLHLHATLRRDAMSDAATATSFAGMCESTVPVKLGTRLVGFLHTGQVFIRPPTEAKFRQTLAIVARGSAPINATELRAAYFATRIVTSKQYQAILSLLKVFAEQLAVMSNQILVTEASTENPQITRAREFIRQNMTEDIHVADCARSAHMSSFYFCKSFKRATGLSFTEYLSRLRTERAKARLLEPHVRVSEVAFEVGFQSLSQFNRVFKRVTGQCPSGYRQDLEGTLTQAARPPAFGETTAEHRPSLPRRDRLALSQSPA